MKKAEAVRRPRPAIREFTRFLGAALLGTALPFAADAQVIDNIEVRRVGDEAEVVIRFNTPIQYQRHSPPTRGEIVNLYFQFLALDGTESVLTREQRSVPRSELLEALVATYPEPNSAMSIRFGSVTNYRVRQGKDNRSISIFVPAKLLPQPPAAVAAAPAAKAAASPALAKIPETAPVLTQPSAAPAPRAAAPAPTPQAPAPMAAAPAPPVAAPPKAELLPQLPAPAEVEAHAAELLAKARKALQQNQSGPSIDALNQLLNLPSNASSQAAQELVGEAREASGDAAKARAEYDLYLNLYPQGEGADRVRDRLARLAAAPVAEAPAAPARPHRETPEGWVTTGSLAQYRYYGQSASNVDPVIVTVNNAGQQFQQQQVNAQQQTRVDQDSLVTNLDMQTRKRTETSDTKLVLRDAETLNYPQARGTSTTFQAHKERLNAAFFEQTDRDVGYMTRIGRQTGTGGGVLGRFDGITAGYNLSPKWRVNGVAGSVVEFGSPYDKTFYGVNADLNAQAEQLGGNLYYIEQKFQGRNDRQGVGLEARYFAANKNLFFTADYDAGFKALNTTMLQANWQTESGYSLFMNVDHRRSPTLMLTSAQDFSGIPLDTLISAFGESAVRDDIKRITPITNSFALGFTRPVSEKWQLGADYRVANVAGIRATQVLRDSGGNLGQSTVSSGNTHVYSVQAIGSNGVFFTSDLLVVNASYFDASHTTATGAYTAEQITFNHVALPSEKWRFDTSLRLYRQKAEPTNTGGQLTTRFGPEFKLLYKLRDNLGLEADASFEKEYRTGGDTNNGHDLRKYYFVGYRWDWQ